MKRLNSSFYRFAWNLHDRTRTILSGCIGLFFLAIINPWLKLEMASIIGLIMAIGIYLCLLAIVVCNADGNKTEQRISQETPNSLDLLIILILIAFSSNILVGILLTAVGNRSHIEAKILIFLSVLAVILAWGLLHTCFGQQYARIYYDIADQKGRPFPNGLRRGLAFPGTDKPAYLDFIYVAFTIALTYAMSDVSIESSYFRRMVLIHSLISFFFYSVILGSVLNAVVTS
ncbi:DUF1345 domain-containing protein [Gloeothece citriformis]|nr:DUF1345 domain-containing protein [Gloeothece citriformis]